jgi:hypothetical protein
VTNNTQARIYDSETEETITYAEIFSGSPISGVTATSNIISYGNTAEMVFTNASGFYNIILTKSGETWSKSIIPITDFSQKRSGSLTFSIIQNDTRVDLFYFGVISATYVIPVIHFHKNKNDNIWIQDSNITFHRYIYPDHYVGFSADNFNCDYSSDNITIFCDGRQISTGASIVSYPILVKINETGGINTAMDISSGWGHSTMVGFEYGYASTSSFSHISDLYNIFGQLFLSNSGTPCGDAVGSGFLYANSDLSIISESSLNDCRFFGSSMKVTGISSGKKNYVFLMRNDTSTYYGFYNSDTLGVNCISTVASGAGSFYFCKDTPHHAGFWTGSRGVSFIDDNGYIQYLYTIPSSSSIVMVAREYQTGDTTWKYHNITTVSNTSLQGYGAIDIGEGIIFTVAQNNFLYFYYENQTNPAPAPPIPPIPPSIADSSVMGMMCGAGSYFTGTDYSGGCQVASLFLLAIILSVMGWLFKYLKHEYGEETPDKYLISGVISAFFIIGFMAIGMSDLLTGIMAVVLILTMIVSYSQSFGGGKK